MEKLGKTKWWSVDNDVNNLIEDDSIVEAAQLLQQNEVVAFPTETVYGLGGNAYSDEAIKKIFAAKGRPTDNPLIIHIYSQEQLNEIVASVPKVAKQLIETFWPGPLTLILPKGKQVSERATAGLKTVAVRMPNHPVALAILERANIPIAAPSANRSGKPSPTTAKHVIADLNDKIAGVVDGGRTGIGVESTVVQIDGENVTILRPGGITREQIETIIGKCHVHESVLTDIHSPQSPGMKYTHYAPLAPLYVVYGNEHQLHEWIAKERAKGHRVGILTTTENVNAYKADRVLACGSRSELSTVAEQLYATLRQFDRENVDVIISESFPKEGIGVAIMNRLEKAATKMIV